MREVGRPRPLSSDKLTKTGFLIEANAVGFDIEFMHDPENDTAQCHKIESGSKTLLLFIVKNTEEEWTAQTYLRNEGFGKNENETTQAYTEAKRIMQEFADKNKIDLSYQINTINRKMAKWSLTKGQEIFNWEHTGHKDTTVDDLQEKLQQVSEDQRFHVNLFTTIKSKNER
jgi:hypothetical protein